MSFDSNPLWTTALAHPVTSSSLYIHMLNKVLWYINGVSRLARCDISSASLLYICTCRYLPLGISYCCRTSGCSLHVCYRGNRFFAVEAVGAFTAAVATAWFTAAYGVLTAYSAMPPWDACLA